LEAEQWACIESVETGPGDAAAACQLAPERRGEARGSELIQ